jgi:outer membrane protein TolC
MSRHIESPSRRFIALAVSVTIALTSLAGCATVETDQSLSRTNQDAAAFTGGKLSLAHSDADRVANEDAAKQLLAKPISQDQAVQLALLNSPAMQALIAQHWMNAANAAQNGRVANPLLTLERLRSPTEIDIGRMLSIGLLDILTLPQRTRSAQNRVEQLRLQLTADVVERVTQVRQSWVSAVAAQQSLSYAQQVFESAEASAELAKRMFAVGNFTKLQRARQQSFYADAATQLASASHSARASRETLVRELGLIDSQAQQLELPTRLPDVPNAPLTAGEVSRSATGRLDVRAARAALDSVTQSQGYNTIMSFTDIEISAIQNTATERDGGARTQSRGIEIAVKLPIFDWGEMKRNGMKAQTLAAGYALEATLRAAGSHLRESYSAYRTAHDISRHYRDEILPLKKQIAEENNLLYNGMLIGVFELLADSRDQIASVIAAIDAQKQFWMTDAALQSAIIGKPMMMATERKSAPTTSVGEAH